MSEAVGETPQNSLALRPGALLDGRYRIVSVPSATSAYAVTYSVFDERDHELLVVKELLPRSLASRSADNALLRPHSAADELELGRAVKRFLHDAELLADLRHPAIVRVQRTFVENGTGYIVMRHVDAMPLERHARVLGGRMPVAQAVEFVLPLLDALETLHANGVLHRDLSPATVHVDSAGHAQLLSFSAHRYLLTHGRELASGFAAIELYGSKGIGPWTDVYSCAALLYYLVTAVVPPSAVDRAAGQAIVAPNIVVPGIAPAFANLIMRALSQLPEQRPHGPGELQRQLVAAVQPVAPPAPAHNPHLHELTADAGAPPAPQPHYTPQDIAAMLTAENPGLRLTAGMVIPEHEGLLSRVGRWIANTRTDRATARELEASADAIRAEATASVVTPPVAPISYHPAVSPAAPPPLARPVQQPVAPLPRPVAPVSQPIVQAAPVVVPVAPTQQPIAPIPQPVVLVPEPVPQPVAAVPEPVVREAVAEVAAPVVAPAPVARVPEPMPSVPAPQLSVRTPDEPVVVSEAAAPSLLVETHSVASEYPAGLQPLENALEPFGRAPRLAMFARRRGSRVATAAAIVLVLGGVAAGVAYASFKQGQDSPSAGAPPSTVRLQPVVAAVPHDSSGRTQSEAGGAVLQTGASTTVRRAETPSRPAPEEQQVARMPVVQPLSLSVSQGEAPRVVPSELLLDLRDRLSMGRQQAEAGSYAAARLTFRAALTQIDSITKRYVTSEGVRGIKDDIDKEMQRVLDACNAENELHRRRGGKIQTCN